MSMKITILGCGNSSGVPSVGNFWGACDEYEPKNRRARCSIAVQSDNTTLIVDTGGDFRHQMNQFSINKIDAVLYTHPHSDHCHGIDDLRGFFFRHGRKAIDVYGSAETLADISKRFDYLFDGGNNEEFYPPMVTAHIFPESIYGHKQCIGDIDFIPYKIDHGTCTVTGYRFGDFAYSVDMKTMDAAALEIIRGAKIWVVDGAAYKNPDNLVHANLETIYAYNRVIGAKEVYISSLSTLMDYQTLKDELPPGFYPAYDGLSFRL
jgi:phosphoribosyl 1,2-cyclic phosphate phosphodiesterase